jgi:hypothetical protein
MFGLRRHYQLLQQLYGRLTSMQNDLNTLTALVTALSTDVEQLTAAVESHTTAYNPEVMDTMASSLSSIQAAVRAATQKLTPVAQA